MSDHAIARPRLIAKQRFSLTDTQLSVSRQPPRRVNVSGCCSRASFVAIRCPQIEISPEKKINFSQPNRVSRNKRKLKVLREWKKKTELFDTKEKKKYKNELCSIMLERLERITRRAKLTFIPFMRTSMWSLLVNTRNCERELIRCHD